MAIVDRLRQPEYTGDNRCTPCTVVNVIIAAIMSAFAALGSTIIGVGVFVFSLVAIYFRGYLVPGTPTFTKRYLPERILRLFDKGHTVAMTEEAINIDPEQALLDANAVESCRNDTDLCLTPAFHDAWRDRIQTVRSQSLDKDHLTNALTISTTDDRITVDQQGDGFLAYTTDSVIGQWSSQAAVIADVAAATELSKRIPRWPNFTPEEIARILMSLRVFIKQCPKCDGSVQVDQELVESCCRSYDVVASACQNCDARLFEMEWDDTGSDESQTQPNQSTQASA